MDCKKCDGTCYVHPECGKCGRDGFIEDEKSEKDQEFVW